MDDTEAYIALNMLPRLGPVRTRRLLERFGSPVAILSTNRAVLQSVEGIGSDTAESIVNWRTHADPSAERALAEKYGAHIVTLDDSAYPAPLREIHDPPVVLYVRGELPATKAIGIVGPRQPSIYGTETAKKLSYQLAYAGVVVVSGLARGIDTAAHQATIAAKGKTIAVLGSGIAKLYPSENTELADRIADGFGAVISEFPMATPPDRQTFPIRNRIVSGLSFGVLVVEAGVTSGTLITANQAAEQGRSIYAVPGKIDSPKSLGANRLIQQGAKLVLSAQDILDDFGLLFRDSPALSRPAAPAHLTADERKIFDAIGDDETPIDTLVTKSGLPVALITPTLLDLELKKAVRMLPGGRVVKTL